MKVKGFPKGGICNRVAKRGVKTVGISIERWKSKTTSTPKTTLGIKHRTGTK
jgi:hypothetical protein